MSVISLPKKFEAELLNGVTYTAEIDLNLFDYIIVYFSGGKDSLACVLNLIKIGIPREKIILFHHCVW